MSDRYSSKPSGSKELARLGDGEVFVKRTQDGILRSVVSNVSLDLRKKEIVKIQSGFMITASGYDRLNKIANLTVVFPPSMTMTILIDGTPQTREVGNPYIEYDPETNAIRTISLTCLAIGLGPIGNWCITHERLRFDLDRYFAMEAWSKVKNVKNAGKFESVSSYNKRDDKDDWIFIPIMPGWGISLDPRHDEVQKVLTNHFQRQKFAERIASTICRRNAMKRHPAIAKTTVLPRDGLATVQVYGWQHDYTAKQINTMISQVSHGEIPPQVEMRQAITEIEHGHDDSQSMESEISSDDMDHTSGQPHGQATLFDQPEPSRLTGREQGLAYLGQCDDRLGSAFLGVVESAVPRIDQVDTFSDLTDEEVADAVSLLREYMGEQINAGDGPSGG